MFLVGGGLSACEVYYAENKVREITRQTGGWSGAMIMARYGASGGAKIGAAIAAGVGQFGPQVATPEEFITVPLGVVLGTIIGGIGGGITGYLSGTSGMEVAFDWFFTPLKKEEWLVHPDNKDNN